VVDQSELLRRVIEILEKLEITYMIVGSFASGAYGEPRLTQDIDVVVDLRPDQIAGLCNEFPEPEYYVSHAAAQDAVRRGGQFNVIHPASGNKVDFLLARRDAWGRSQIARRQKVLIFPDRPGYVARAEDVILGKLCYYQEGGSEKHLRDITGIMRISGEEVDTAYVSEWAVQLGVTDVWQAVLDRLAKE
jgi:hypothetical protein